MQAVKSLIIRSQRIGFSIDREVVAAPDGMIGLSQDLKVERESAQTFVTGNAVIFTYVEAKDGSFFIGDQQMPSRFLLYIPEYSLINIRLAPGDIFSLGVVSKKKIFNDISIPIIIENSEQVKSISSLLKINSIDEYLPVDPDLNISPVIKETRRYLKDCLTSPNPIAKASSKYKMTSYELSKKFKTAYKISPKSYVNRVRLFDAVFFLLTGKDIITSALESGFCDLKRFYSQFAKCLNSTPGEYKVNGKKRQESLPRT